MKRTSWLVLAAFAAGCVTSAVLMVPRATASTVQRWEHWCMDVDGVPKTDDIDRAGVEGWELVTATFRPPVVQQGSSTGGGATYLCFKRPR